MCIIKLVPTVCSSYNIILSYIKPLLFNKYNINLNV